VGKQTFYKAEGGKRKIVGPPKASERPQLNGWAPGGYLNECGTCKELFTGDKRAHTCALCAYHDIDILKAALVEGDVELFYPASRLGLHRTKGPLLDFVNQFLRDNPGYNGHFWREDGTGSGAHLKITRSTGSHD